MAFTVVQDCPTIISGGKGCIKDVAQNRGHSVSRKKAIAETLTPGAIAYFIQLVSNFLCLNSVHPKFPDQTQAREILWVLLRRLFRSGTPVSKWDISIVK